MRIRMEDVVLGLSLAPRITKSQMDIRCPSCGHNTLHFDFGEQVFACPVCAGVGGGVIDAWAFFRGIEGHTKKETRSLAKKDLEQYYGKNPKPQRQIGRVIEYEKPVALASEDERDEFYRKMLSSLILTKEHQANLRKRGLTDAQIKNSKIRTFRRLSSKELQSLFPNKDLSHFPGFYMRNGKPYMVDFGPGMLLPEMSIDGKIQGFQIRRDTDDKKRRYITLSSSKYGGASGPTFTHFSNWKNYPVKKCIITEGPLKGAIINYFTGTPVIAVPGVNSQKYLNEALEILKKRGLQEVEIAFDMDFYTKKGVQDALANLRKKLSDLEIPFYQLKWNTDEKGYDDYLLSKRTSR